MHYPSIKERPDLAIAKPAITKKSYAKFVKFDQDNSTKEKVQLTITVVAYRERELLLDLVDKLLLTASSSRILVVDNGLDSDIKDALKSLPIHYIEATENLGCTKGRNFAVSFVTTPFVSFLDADAKIGENYIAECLSIMKNTDVVCARGKVLPLTDNGFTPNTYNLGENSFPWFPNTEGVSIWRTKDFLKAGGFEDELYGGEGIVLCYRMVALLGYSYDQFIYAPSLILYHDYVDPEPSHEELLKKFVRNTVYQHHIDVRYPLLQNFLQVYRDTHGETATIDKSGISQFKDIIKESKAIVRKEEDELASAKADKLWTNGKKTIKNPTFSVVIPCFNLGPHLKNGVMSVMGQTLDNVEIIVVDDCSTDKKTIEVLQELEKHITVVYRKKNGGASAARNTGVAHAKGNYILCLDADDIIRPTYLEEAFNVFEAHRDIGVVGSYAEVVGERKGQIKPKDNPSLIDGLIASPIPNASCFRKSTWKEVGGYDENLRGMEDWEFWISILETKWVVRVLPRYHYVYLTRPNSKVKTSNKKVLSIVEYIATKHKKSFEQNIVAFAAEKHKSLIEYREKLEKTRTWLTNAKQREANLLEYVHATSYPERVYRVMRRKAHKVVSVLREEKNPLALRDHFRRNIQNIKRKAVDNRDSK